MRVLLLAFLFIFATVAFSDERYGANEKRVVITTTRGVEQPFLRSKPRGAPLGVVLLFPGSNGRLTLTDDMITNGAQNFVVRTRQRFAEAGYLTVLVDVPSDHRDGIGDGYRTGPTESDDIGSVLKWIQKRWRVPIFLVGTSRGTISAANVSSRLGNQMDGLILTASVTTGTRATLYDVALGDIRTPTFLVHHIHDGCRTSLYPNVLKLQKALSNLGNRAALVSIDGGGPEQSPSCGPLSFHGFFGSEDGALSAILDFIRNAVLVRTGEAPSSHPGVIL